MYTHLKFKETVLMHEYLIIRLEKRTLDVEKSTYI